MAVGARRVTESLRHELVEDQISYVTEEQLQSQRRVEVPATFDGEGVATEIMLSNPRTEAVIVNGRFLSPERLPKEIVLR